MPTGRSSKTEAPTTGARFSGEWTPIEIDTVESVATNPDVYELARVLPARKQGDTGRPSIHPDAVYVIYVVLAGALGSHRKAASAIGNPRYWRIVRHAARDIAKLTLPRTPPTRNQCEYHRAKIADNVETIAARFRVLARQQAHEHGCFAPDAPRSASDLRRANFVAADGKVVKSPVLKKTADRWREQGRHLDATMHVQGGEAEHEVFGAKFWFAVTRPGNDRNQRIVIDMRRVPKRGYGGEAGIATPALLELADHEPGLRGICYDGALRGTHIDQLIKHGLVVMSPTHGGTKSTALKRLSCTCGDTHDLWTDHGRICEREVLDTGEKTYQPCPIAKIYPRRNIDGTFRWYLDFAPSCGTVHTERIDITKADAACKYNRTEHIRQHTKAPDDEHKGVYDRCYGWREDSESVNDILQEKLHKRRMIAYTSDKQFLVMLGHAIGRNSLARYIRTQRSAAPPGIAA